MAGLLTAMNFFDSEIKWIFENYSSNIQFFNEKWGGKYSLNKDDLMVCDCCEDVEDFMDEFFNKNRNDFKLITKEQKEDLIDRICEFLNI